MYQINLIWNGSLHVSHGISAHHQEFKRWNWQHLVPASKQTAVSVWLLYVQSWTADDGRKDRPKHVECYSKQTAVSVWLLYVQSWTADDGRKDRPKHVECYSKQTAVSVWQMHVAVCTVLNSWWWTERPSETCRVLQQADSSICLVAVCTVLNCWWWTERPSETCRVLQQADSSICLVMYSLELLTMDGKTVRNM